jgi:hypothetical protein
MDISLFLSPSLLSPSFSLSLSLFLTISLSLSLALSLSLSLTGEEGVCTLFTGQRKRDIYKERERERKREIELHAHASRKCGHALSIPHSVSQSVSMRDYYINSKQLC